MLIDFINANDLSNVEKQLQNENINQVDEFGYSLLHISISKGFDEVSEFLMRNGIDPNTKDHNGQTSLHYCAFYNKIDLAKIIISNNGMLDIEDNYGNEPLWTAVFNDYGRNERIEIISLFIKHGANISHKNKVSKSPFDIVKTRPYENLFSLFQIVT